MRPMYDALLAAVSPVDAPADLYEIRTRHPSGSSASLAGAAPVIRRGLLRPENVVQVSQPRDRGTLPEVLLALLELLPRDPEALLVVTGTDQAPAAVVSAVTLVVERPGEIVLLRPEAPTLAEGFGFVVEARTLLRLLLEEAPVWAGLMCESMFDDTALERAYQMLPLASIESVVRARATSQPAPAHVVDIRRFAGRTVGLA